MPQYGKLKIDQFLYNDSGTDVTLNLNDIAPKNNPTFTGTVTVPTATAGDNTTKAASTAFVVASFAPKASPTFTGTPAAPTASANTNTTQIATTAYVQTELGDYAPLAAPAFTGNATGVNLTLSGNLTVNGTQTIINTQTLDVEDKQIEIGKVSSPSDTTADQGGWKLKGSSDKTFLWINATDAWTSSEHIHLLDNKKLFIGGASGTTDGLEIVHNASDSVLNDTGTGSLKLQLSGATKLEITSAGTTVTGAVTATSFTGSGANLTNLPPGGNTFTAVADGAIANNKCVRIGTDGKVSEIKEIMTGMNATYASDTYTTNSGAGHTSGKLLYDPDQHKVVVFYTGTSYATNNMEYSVLQTIQSGASQGNTSSRLSDRQKVESEIKSYPSGFEWGDVAYESNSNKYLWIGRDMNDNNVYAKTGTYSTVTDAITWEQTGRSNCSQPLGSGNAGRGPRIHFDETTNRIVALVRDDSNSNRPTVIIGSYNTSSNTIDWGTKQQLDTSGISDNDTVMCRAGNATGQIFVGYKTSNSLKGNLITVSSSSNTCTIQTAATIQSQSDIFRVAYNVEDQNIIFAFKDDSDSSKGKIARLTINSGGTGFDKSSLLQFCINPNDSAHDVIYSISAKQVFCTYRPSVSSQTNQVFRITNTTGTPTKAADENISGAGTIGNWLYSKGCSSTRTTTAGKLYGAYTLTNQSLPVTSYNVSVGNSNLAAQYGYRYVGFADAAYTNGQTATIKTYGNNVSTLSGLTPGSLYYVQKNGSVATSPDGFGWGNAPGAGIALTSSTLLIKDPHTTHFGA